MSSTPISGRLQAFLLGTFVLACAAYLAVRFWPRDHVRALLVHMPAEAAVLAYVDVPGLSGVAADVSLALPWTLGLAANRLDGIALALAEHEIYVAASGDFSATLIGALLASQGIRCAASLDVTPCAADLGHGPVLVGIPGPGTLAASTADSLSFSNSAEFHGDEARDALSAGAVIWAAIDPPLLDAAMEDPPPEWINLQIVARALEPARVAFFTVKPLAGDNVSIRVEAYCDDADREQLERVLGGVNDMALALLSRDGAAAEQWAPALKSFESSQGPGTVRVEWTVPAALLAELW